MFTSYLFHQFSDKLPHISKTEREALDAGTIWWEAELFRGKPDWQQLHQYREPRLSQEELSFIDGPVNHVCTMINDYHITHELADLPPDVWAYLKKHRFFAMIIKKQYGGLEFSAYAQSIVLQKLAGISSILSITVGVPNSLAPENSCSTMALKHKNTYLPKLASGQEIPCFALTSTEAGSDATSIPDYGIVCQGMWEGRKSWGYASHGINAILRWPPLRPLLDSLLNLKIPIIY
ncbi:acyl-CoA dehydrogenase family protein [Vibrio sp. PP-XX7]